jgi:hypothetical protein
MSYSAHITCEREGKKITVANLSFNSEGFPDCRRLRKNLRHLLTEEDFSKVPLLDLHLREGVIVAYGMQGNWIGQEQNKPHLVVNITVNNPNEATDGFVKKVIERVDYKPAPFYSISNAAA